MTKRDKRRWKTEVRRLLWKSVYGIVDEAMFTTQASSGDDEGASMLAYGERLEREFKAAIKKVR